MLAKVTDAMIDIDLAEISLESFETVAFEIIDSVNTITIKRAGSIRLQIPNLLILLIRFKNVYMNSNPIFKLTETLIYA